MDLQSLVQAIAPELAEPLEYTEEMEEESAALSEDEILAAIRMEVDLADDALQERMANRDEAVEYFYGRLPAPPKTEEMRATIVSTDVGDAVEAILAEIMPAFSGIAPVEFVPFSQEDEQKADQETRAVSYVAAASGAYMAMSYAIQDALLRRAGIVKVYWEEITEAIYERHEGIDQMMLPNIVRPDDDVIEAQPDEQGLYSLTLRRYSKKSKPMIRAVPVTEFLISSEATNDIDQKRFLAHRRPVSRHDMVSLGFDREKVAELSAVWGSDVTGASSSLETGHESTEAVMAIESYYRLDEDGDGIAELRRIVTAGGAEGTDELMLDEVWEAQPFCVGVGYLGMFTWDGVSIFDKLRTVQDTKTQLLRNLLDASERNVRQRLGVLERQVNMDDVMTSVMGGIVRMTAPGAVFPIPDVVVPPQIFQVLTYMDEVRRDKGGGAIDTASQAIALAGDSAHGIERMMSAAEQLQAMIAKNLAETLIKPLYRKLHALLRKYWEGEIRTKAGSAWQSEQPKGWQARDELVISMGLSVGERGRRVAALQAVIANQNAAMASGMGGAAVGGQQLYAAQIDLARMAGLPGPETYWIDPESPESKNAAAKKQQQAAEAAKKKDALTQQQLNVPIEMEKIKAQSSAADAKLRAAQAQASEQLKAEVSMQKAEMDQRMKVLENRIKLMELNAAFDAQPVPDTLTSQNEQTE